MVWHVTTEVPTGIYMVEHPTQRLPIELGFHKREPAQDLADWLNKKDNWTDRLELIIEHETDIDLEKLKK